MPAVCPFFVLPSALCTLTNVKQIDQIYSLEKNHSCGLNTTTIYSKCLVGRAARKLDVHSVFYLLNRCLWSRGVLGFKIQAASMFFSTILSSQLDSVHTVCLLVLIKMLYFAEKYTAKNVGAFDTFGHKK